ncbi:MAG: restriction endonuclease subunit S [Bacteroidales bacterium]|nr:restriction endonuclease subunit S [Bacteroidales bacterium]
MNVYDFVFDYNGLAFIDDEQAYILRGVKVEENDILLNITGASVARCCMVPKQILPARVNQHVSIVRVDPKRANPQYVLFFINSPSYKNYLVGLSSAGATREALTKEVIENLKIPLPSLSIQLKIASILSAYDELIENNNQRIKLLEQMAEDIYKEWFVRMRFPGYETTKFLNIESEEVKQSAIDATPEGWETVKLRVCFAQYIGGGWGEEVSIGKFDRPAYVIRGTDIPDARIGNLNFEVLRYHSSSNLASRKLQANDIIFEVSGGTESQSLGRSLLISQSIINRFDKDLICASFCKLIRVKQEFVSSLYIYALLNRLYQTGEIMLFQVQSTGISNYKFEDFIDSQKVLVPPVEIQNNFVRIIQPMFDEIQILGVKNQLLQQTAIYYCPG